MGLGFARIPVRMKNAATLGFLLRKQREAQLRIPPARDYPLFGEQLADNVRNNVLAATDELHELLNEVGWKQWKKTGYGTIRNRQAYIDELADVVLFVLNLGNAADVTGVELMDAIERKWASNQARQEKGY